MERGLCRRPCETCVFHKSFDCSCGNEYCIVYQCLNGGSFPGITHPSSKYCLYRVKYGICDCVNRVPTRWIYPEVDIELYGGHLDLNQDPVLQEISVQRYIPVIDLNDSNTWVWDIVDVKYICVSLYQLIKNKSLYNEVIEKGLHNYLGYDGFIILSSIMPDEYLDTLSAEDYLSLVKNLDADILTSLDNYTYYDEPYYISWSQLIKGLKSIQILAKLNKPILPLLKGGSLKQIDFSLNYLKAIGVKYLMFPISGLSRDNKMLLMKYVRLIESDYKFNYIIYGGPSHFIYLLKNAYGYIGSEWYRKSLQYRIFEDGFFIYLDSSLDSEIKLKKHNINNLKDLLIHNLQETIRFYRKYY